MKEKSVWVVSLAGKHVFHGNSIQCVITCISDLNMIREQIKEKHALEFTSDLDTVQYHPEAYRSYRNITDDRDITLTVERTTLYYDIILR